MLKTDLAGVVDVGRDHNTLFFCSVGKSLSIKETSHRPWGSLSLSVMCFKVLKSHNDHVNTAKVYQYSKFCNFTHKHSNIKCVHSKDIDTLTGDGSAVGHCTVGQPRVALAHENLLRDPVLWLVSNWVKLYLQNSVFLFTLSLTKLRSSYNQLRALKETVSVLHLCICWKFVVCSLNANSSAITSLVPCSHPLSVSSLHELLFSQTQGGGEVKQKNLQCPLPNWPQGGGSRPVGYFSLPIHFSRLP